jgi:hypothetical protein
VGDGLRLRFDAGRRWRWAAIYEGLTDVLGKDKEARSNVGLHGSIE